MCEELNDKTTELITELSVSEILLFVYKQFVEYLLSLYILEIAVVMGWF